MYHPEARTPAPPGLVGHLCSNLSLGEELVTKAYPRPARPSRRAQTRLGQGRGRPLQSAHLAHGMSAAFMSIPRLGNNAKISIQLSMAQSVLSNQLQQLWQNVFPKLSRMADSVDAPGLEWLPSSRPGVAPMIGHAATTYLQRGSCFSDAFFRVHWHMALA